MQDRKGEDEKDTGENNKRDMPRKPNATPALQSYIEFPPEESEAGE